VQSTCKGKAAYRNTWRPILHLSRGTAVVAARALESGHLRRRAARRTL